MVEEGDGGMGAYVEEIVVRRLRLELARVLDCFFEGGGFGCHCWFYGV